MNKKLLKQKITKIRNLKRDLNKLESETHDELAKAFLPLILKECKFNYYISGLHEIDAPPALIEEVVKTLNLMDRWTWKIALSEDLYLSQSNNRLDLEFRFEDKPSSYNTEAYTRYCNQKNKEIADKYGIKFDFSREVDKYKDIDRKRLIEQNLIKEMLEIFRVKFSNYNI